MYLQQRLATLQREAVGIFCCACINDGHAAMMRQIPQGLAAGMSLCSGLQSAKNLPNAISCGPFTVYAHHGIIVLSDSHMFR